MALASPRAQGWCQWGDQAAWLFGLTEVLCTVRAKHFKDGLAVSTPVFRWEGESPSQGAPDSWEGGLWKA